MVGEGIDKKAARKPQGPDYVAAEKKYVQKKFREAIKLYQKAEESKDMDVKGL